MITKVHLVLAAVICLLSANITYAFSINTFFKPKKVTQQKCLLQIYTSGKFDEKNPTDGIKEFFRTVDDFSLESMSAIRLKLDEEGRSYFERDIYVTTVSDSIESAKQYFTKDLFEQMSINFDFAFGFNPNDMTCSEY